MESRTEIRLRILYSHESVYGIDYMDVLKAIYTLAHRNSTQNPTLQAVPNHSFSHSAPWSILHETAVVLYKISIQWCHSYSDTVMF